MTVYLEYIGKFHPVILHLPIGAFIYTFVLAILGHNNLEPYKKAIKVGMLISFLGALLSSILGYLLYKFGDYAQEAVQNHLYLGWSTTLVLGIMFFKLNKICIEKRFSYFLLVGVILITTTAHFGGQLTHGEGYLDIPKTTETVHYKKTDSIRLYEQVVSKIFDQKCVSCHNNAKKKGMLALDRPEHITKGGEKGAALIPFRPSESRMINYAQLPLEDELHMPPEGKLQLSSEEIQLISYWIEKGASYTNTEGLNSLPDQLRTSALAYLPDELPVLKALSKKQIEQLQHQNFRVEFYAPENSLLELKYMADALDAKAVRQMSKIAEHIIHLDLDKVAIHESFWTELHRFKYLKKLRISNSNVQNSAISKLLELDYLQSLNLTSTEINAEGLRPLLQKKSLEQIYLWNSAVPKAQQEELQRESSIDLDFGIVEGFFAPQQLKSPELITENTFFSDALKLEFYNPIKGIEIRYTLDGSEPDSSAVIYREPFLIDQTTPLKAKSFKKGWIASEAIEIDLFKVGKKIENYVLRHKPSDRYNGVSKLFDFQEGSINFSDGNWLGFSGKNLEFTTKLDQKDDFKHISISCMESSAAWILYPKSIRVMGKKLNSNSFELISKLNYTPPKIPTEVSKKSFTLEVDVQAFEELKVIVENAQKLPKWHPSAGEDAWLFVDEVLFW